MSDRPRRLILAYVVLGLGVIALFGAVTGRGQFLVFGASFGYIAAVLQGFSFFLRARRRRDPAVLLGYTRTVLAVTLAVVAATALGNLVTVWTCVHHGPMMRRSADAAGAFAWAIALAVLCWRAWILPSARRAAVLQLVAVVLAVPGLIGATATAVKQGYPVTDLHERALDASLFITFVVVGGAGPVLDKLFASVTDRGPEIIPRRCCVRDAVVIALFAAAVAAAGCNTVAEGAQFDRELEAMVKTKGLEATVHCPAHIPLGKVEDNHFVCGLTSKATGAEGTIQVKLDDKGSIAARWEIPGGARAPAEPFPPSPPDTDGDPWN